MSFYKNVQVAFDKSLNSLANGISVAWPGMKFTSEKGYAYLRPTLMFSPSNLLSLVGAQANPGLYQIDLFYPPEKGPAALLVKMDEIYNHYKAAQTLTEGGFEIYIKEVTRETPEGGQNGGVIIAGKLWFAGSLGINFNCYSS